MFADGPTPGRWTGLSGMAEGMREFLSALLANDVVCFAMSPIVMAALWKHSFEPHTAPGIDTERYFQTSLDLLLRGIERTPFEGARA